MKEEKETSIEKILAKGIGGLKEAADASCTIGEKIYIGDLTLVPISKVSVGYVNGGGEYGENQKLNPMVSGGGGGGYSVSPIAFVCVNNKTGDVKMLSIDEKTSFEKIFDIVPKIVANIMKEENKK